MPMLALKGSEDRWPACTHRCRDEIGSFAMFACVCRGITESDVRRAGAGGVTSPSDLIAVFSLDDQTCCGRCANCIDEFVDLACQGAREAPSHAGVIAELRPLPAGIRA